MSNPPHKHSSNSDRFSDDPPSSDIPPARRQPADIPLHEIERASAKPGRNRRSRRYLLLGLLAIGTACVVIWQWNLFAPDAIAPASVKQTWEEAIAHIGRQDRPDTSTASPSSAPSSAAPSPTPSGLGASLATESATAEPAADTLAEQPASAEQSSSAPLAASTDSPSESRSESRSERKPDTLLNHRRYDEAPTDELVALNPNSLLKLQPAAQQAVSAMLAKAKAEGVQLGVISAFRTLEDQDYLYFQVKAERGQSAKTRAEVSAPPGYSEHHTGYAVDFIDEGRPETMLNQAFETTPAYQWLNKNAPFFNFEMSFPKDESSGVSYEPWHWRYVGDQKSLELFYKE